MKPMEADQIGKKIDYPAQGTYTIKDFVHGHFYMVRESDGYDKMEKSKYVMEMIEEARIADTMCGAYGQIFAEHGAFPGWDDFTIDGVMGGPYGKNCGCMSDRVTVKAHHNEYDDYLEIGNGGRSYTYHNLIKRDPNKPFGYTVLDGQDDMELEKRDWFPIEELLDRMMAKVTKELDKTISFNGQFDFAQNKDGTYFWKGDRVYHLQNPEVDESWQRKYWVVLLGKIRVKPTDRAKGNARHSRYKCDWSFPPSSGKRSGSEIRQMILDLCKDALSEVSFRRPKHE